MPNVEHGLLQPHLGSGIHPALGWPPFASDADRLNHPLVPTDVGKIALVEDTERTFMLVNYSPPRWVEWIDGGVLDGALDDKADDADIASLQLQINQKADAAATQAALNTKADLTYVDTELNFKADQADLVTLQNTVVLKADTTYVDAQLALKADQSALDALAATSASDAELQALAAEVATKADQADLDAKADASAVSAALATKANQADLVALEQEVAGKADQTYVDSQLVQKADTTWVQQELDKKADRSELADKADIDDVAAALSLKADITYVDAEDAALGARIDTLQAEVDQAELDVSQKVTGPVGATDQALVRYDGTTGKLVQDSPALLSDTGDLSIAGSLVTGGTVDGVDLGTLETIVEGHDAELLTAVHGPAASNDNQIPRYDGTTGLLLDAPTGGPSIDDTGNILLSTGATVDGYDVSMLGAMVDGHDAELAEKVEGPLASTDQALMRWDGTDGKLAQDSLVTVDDTGELAAPSLDVTGDIAVGGLVDGVDVAAMKATVDQHSAALPALVAGPEPAASTDNAVVRWDGTGGRTSQDSLVTIDDAGNISLPAGATVDGVDLSEMGASSGAFHYVGEVYDMAALLALTASEGDVYRVVQPSVAADEFGILAPAASLYGYTDSQWRLLTPTSVTYLPIGSAQTYADLLLDPGPHTQGTMVEVLQAGQTSDGVSFAPKSTFYWNGSAWLLSAGVKSSGGVAGPTPATSTDNAVMRWDGTGGRTSQNSLVTIDDAGNLSLPVGATVDGVDVSALSTTVSGKVTGPASSTLNAIARYADTSGKLTKNCGVLVDDSNNITGVASATCTSLTVNGNITVSGTVDGVDVSTLNTTVTGKMAGAASSTLNTIVKYGDTTGKLAKASGVTVDDSNNISGVASLTATSATVNGNITVSGTVDGVDVSTLNTTVSTLNTTVSNLGSHHVRAKAGSGQSIASHTVTTVALGTEVLDPKGAFASNVFTCQVAGVYAVFGYVDVGDNGTNGAGFNIVAAGVTTGFGLVYRPSSSKASGSILVSLAPGNTVYLEVVHQSGVVQTIMSAELSVFKIA